MPTNKNAMYRYLILNDCFRNKYRNFTIDILCKYVNEKLKENGLPTVSERQIKSDIAEMKINPKWNVKFDETLFDGKKKIYRYEDTDYSIENLSLNEQQKSLIKSILDLTEQISGIEQIDRISEFKVQLSQLISENYNQQNNPTVIFEKNNYVSGLNEWWEKCLNAIQNKCVLKIVYNEFCSKEKNNFIISPYCLKEYNNRWFLICLNHEDKTRLYNLPLDRVEQIYIENQEFIESTFDIKDYYSDVVGVTVYQDEKIEDIHFKVYGKTAHYVATKPIHESQIQHWENDVLDVHLKVKINYELEHTLLSFIPFIKIISPKSLVDKHIEILKTSLNFYK
ncbi:MAG: WYL domain-containing protein [Bacteroidales bacterium]|nr:WYL domain-containing protein [Bacteroidales bacterium]